MPSEDPRDGDPPAAPADGAGASDRETELLLQHRHDVETERITLLERVSKVRSGGLSLAIVLVLAVFLLQRFLYVASTERWTMAALPLLVLVATGLVDVLYYHPQVQAKARRVAFLEARLRESGGPWLIPDDPDQPEEIGRGLVIAYYLVPLVALVALALWRLL